MSFEQQAAAAFIDFPTPCAVGPYAVHTRQVGKLLITSGALPFGEGKIQVRGRLGLDVTLERGRQAARLAGIQALAMVREAVGSLDRIRQIVHVTGYVASGPEFYEQEKVIEGASQLLNEIFGTSGAHTRTAVGVASLPHAAAVQLELIVEIK